MSEKVMRNKNLRVVGKDETLEKCVLVITSNKTIVGYPKYEEITDELGQRIVVCTEVRDAIEFFPIVIPQMQEAELDPRLPLTQQRKQSMGMTLQFVPLLLGTITDISDSVSMVDLDNKSPYYMQYVAVTTGIRLAH